VKTGIKCKVDLALSHLFTPRRQCNIKVNSKMTPENLTFSSKPHCIKLFISLLMLSCKLILCIYKGLAVCRIKCFVYFIYFVYFGLFVVCFAVTSNLLDIFTLFHIRNSVEISLVHLCKTCTVFRVPHLPHFLTFSTTLTNHDEPISKMRAIDWMTKCIFPGNVHGFPLFAITVIINLSSIQTLVTSLSMINGVGVRGKHMRKLNK